MRTSESGRHLTRSRRAGSEAGWGEAEQDARWTVAGVRIPVRDPRGVGDRVALLEAIVLLTDPEIEATLDDDDDLLVRVVSVGLVAGPAAGLDRREDDLQLSVRAGCQ